MAAASDLPIMVYNNPVSYHVDITPEMFAELADEPKLVAIKESSENVRRITDLKNVCGDRYMLFCGVDDLVLESLLLGAAGWVSGLVNAFPAENRLLWDLATSRPLGRGPARSIAGTRRSCTSTPTSSSSSTSSSPCRNAATAPSGPRTAAALDRRGARADSGDHPPRHRDEAEDLPDNPRQRAWPDDGISTCHRVQVIDSHTGGEPTRVVIAGGPELGDGTMAERLAVFRDRHDAFRSAVVNEPRGSDVMVGRSCSARPSTRRARRA